MINYLLMIFGINCKNKWIATFLTGITLSIFSLILVQIITHISFGDEIKILIFKISCAIALVSKITSFILLKFKSTKIFELYDRLIDYQIESFITYNNHYISTVIFILFTITAIWIGTSVSQGGVLVGCSPPLEKFSSKKSQRGDQGKNLPPPLDF